MPEDDNINKTYSHNVPLLTSPQADGNAHLQLPEETHGQTDKRSAAAPITRRHLLESLDQSAHERTTKIPAVVLPLDVTRYTVMTKSRNLQAHSLGSDKLTKDCPTAGEAHVRWMSCGVDGGRRIDCPEQHGWCRGKCTSIGRRSLW